MRKRKQINSGYISVSPFIDKKVFEYSIKLINSSYTRQMTEKVLEYIKNLLGEDLVESTLRYRLKKDRPKIVKKSDDWFGEELSCDYSVLKKLYSATQIAKILKIEFFPIIERYYQKYNQLTTLDQKLLELKHIFHLTSTDLEIISFLFVMSQSTSFAGAFNGSGEFADFTEKYPFLSHGWKLLNSSKNKIRQSLHSGNLVKCELVDIDRVFNIEYWVEDYLSGLEPNLNKKFFSKIEGGTLPLEAHFADKEELDVLVSFLKRKDATNILFYGEPGTGKTELAKSLATHSQKKLYTINNKDKDCGGSADMKTSIIASCNILNPKTSIILVDEADALLNTQCSFFFSGEKNNKNWINHFLDHSTHKIIWITNRSTEIESSTMRRFSFSMQFKRFNLKKKLQVFSHSLKKKNLEFFFTEEEIQGFCRRYSVNAGGISNAINNLKIRKNTSKSRVVHNLDIVLKNHETAITGREQKGNKVKGLDKYSLEALNTSENLGNIVTSVERFLDRQSDLGSGKRSNLNVLLYGVSGSGKTEFVKYLGQELKREIVLKRASDLTSCWVGETEKNISRVFDEAEDNQSILFLDEADSFLSPRENARNSWEKTEVNELLTQMENFNGVLVCATNFLKGLDQAALRRFKFKIEFLPLTPEGNLEMYHTVLQPILKRGALPKNIKLAVKSLCNLTPGDFHIVAEKFELMTIKPTHQYAIKSLEDEIKFKPNDSTIGFGG